MKNYIINTNTGVIVFNPETYDIYVSKSDSDAIACLSQEVDGSKFVQPLVSCNNDLDIQAANICMCETCNLACTYCFFHAGTFDKAGGKLISLETLVKTYRMLEANSKSGLKSIGFYGGEPLINFKIIRDFVEYVKSNSDHSISFGVITNGTLLTQEMVEFFNEHKFYVSISLDGTKEYNDRCRKSKDGRSVFDMVMEKLTLLKNKRFLLSSQSTLANDFFKNYQKGTVEQYFDTYYSVGFDNIIPVTADLEEGYTEEEYVRMREFFQDVVDYSFACFLNDETKYQPPVYIAKMISNLASKRYEGECQAGSKYVFVTVDGDIYPCQMHYMMNVDKMNINGEIKKKGCATYRRDIDECRDCYCKNI